MAKKNNLLHTGKNYTDPDPIKAKYFADIIKKEKEVEAEAIKKGEIVNPSVVKELSGNLQESNDLEITPYYPDLAEDTYDKYKGYISDTTLSGRQLDIQTLNEMRFENQSAWEQAGNAVGRLATNIVPQILSGAASMLDIPGYWDAEHAANNAIVNWANDVKEWSNEAMPIYENPNDAHDFGSFAWWFSRGESLVESIAAFAATGWGAGMLVKGVGIAIKAANAGRNIGQAALGAVKAQKLGQGAQQIGTAVMMNQAEAVMEASQVYKTIIEQKLAKGYSYDEARKAAAEGASTTMNVNRLNIALNLTSAKMFMSPIAKQRELIKQFSTMGGIKGALAESGQEALEEVVNHIASKKGEATGMSKDYTWDDVIKDITSVEGIEAAFLGALGGGGQKAFVGGLRYSKYRPGSSKDEAGNRISAVTAHKQSYEKQQKVIEELKANGVKITDAIKQSIAFGLSVDQLQNAKTPEEQQEVLKQSFAFQVKNALATGTQSVLEEMINETISSPDITPEEKANAQNAKLLFKDLEKIYYNAEQYENVDEVYLNKLSEHSLKEAQKKASNGYNNINAKFQQEATEIAKKYKFVKKQEVINKVEGKEVGRSTNTQQVPMPFSLNNLEENLGDTEENQKIYDRFLNEVKGLPSYQEKVAFEETLNKVNDEVVKNQNEFKEITSPKYQEQQKKAKEQAKIEKELYAQAEKETSISKLEDLKQKTKNKETQVYIDKRIDTIKNAQAETKKTAETNKIKRMYSEQIDKASEGDLEKLEQEIAQSDLDDTVKTDIQKMITEKRNNPVEPITLERFGLTPSDNHGEEFNKGQDNSQIDPDFKTEKEKEADVEKQVVEIAEKIAEENNGVITNEDGTTYAYARAHEGNNRAAYLSRVFDAIYDSIKNVVTRKEITDTIDRKYLLGSKKYGAGTKINISVNEEYDGEVYDSLSKTKEKVLWQNKLADIKARHGANYKNSKEYIEEVPLIVRDTDGNEIFYIHTVSWLTEENLDATPEQIKEDRDKLVAIRKTVLASNKPITTTITKKTTGTLLRATKKMSTGEAFPEGSATFAIVKNNVFEFIKKGKKITQKVKNKNMPSNGSVVAIVPNGDGQIALPLSKGKITAEDADTIIKVIKLFLEGDATNPILQQIYNATGISIVNGDSTEGLRQFLQQYIYLYPTVKNNGLDPILNSTDNKINSNDFLITVTGNSIQFGLKNVVTRESDKSVPGVTISKNFKDSPKRVADKLAKLHSYLMGEKYNVTANVDLDTFQNIGTKFGNTIKIIKNTEGKDEVVTVPYEKWINEKTQSNVFAVNAGTDEKPEWVTTIQPTIEFDTTFAENTKSTTQSTNNEIETLQKENIQLGESILQKAGYKNENRLPNGNVKGGQAGWKIRFNIKNPKTDSSYYDEKNPDSRDTEYNKRAETISNFLLNYFGSKEKADSKNLEKHQIIEDADGSKREPFKHLSGGEIGESDFTIYIGSADDVLKFISDIRTKHPEILELLHSGNQSSDIMIDDIFKGRIEGRKIGFSGYHTPTNLHKITGNKDFTFVFNGKMVNVEYKGDNLGDIYIASEETGTVYRGVFDENLKNDLPELYKNIRNIIGFQLYGKYLTGSNNEFNKLTNIQTQQTITQPQIVKEEPVAQSKPLDNPQLEQIAQLIASQPDATIEGIDSLLGQNAVAMVNGDPAYDESVFPRAKEILKERQDKINNAVNEVVDEVKPNTPVEPKSVKNPFTNEETTGDAYLNDNVDDSLMGEEEVEEEPESEEVNVSEAMKEASKDLLLKDVPLTIQNDLINYLTSTIVQEGIRLKEEEGVSKFDTSKIFNQQLKALKEQYETFVKLGFVNKANVVKSIIDQYEQVRKMTNRHIALVTSGKIDDSFDEDEAGGLVKYVYSDEWSLTLDSKKTASANLKKFFSAINEVDSEGKTKVNSIGLPVIIPFDTVYNTLHEILANKKADYDLLIRVLEAHKDSLPWSTSVIKLLKKSPESIQNEFVTDMTKHHISMEFILWEKSKNGFTAKIWNSNSSSTAERLRVVWKSNLKSDTSQSPIINSDEEGNYMFNNNELDIMIEQAEIWSKKPPVLDVKNPQESDLAIWLGKLGIVLNDNTYKALSEKQFIAKKGPLHYTELFTNRQGLVNVLGESLKKIRENNKSTKKEERIKFEDTDLFADTVVKQLARLEAVYTTNTISNSFSAGNKTVFSYGNNKWLINRFRDLINDSELQNDLKELSFTQDSLWLKQLQGEDSNSVAQQMKLTYLSLEALKKKFSKSKDDAKLNQLAAIEHEVTKMAFFFQSGQETIDGETKRKVGYFYPTTSDKSGQHVIHQFAHSVFAEDVENGKTADDESVEMIYNTIILPEMRRINNENKTTINGYEPTYFYFIPELNTLKLKDEKTLRELARDGEVTDEVKELVKEYLKNTFLPKVIEQKVEDWRTLGVVEDDMSAINFIDYTYFNNKKGVGNTTKDRIYFAATDYVVNYMIANAEMYKLFVGDPAQFAKFKKGKSIQENLEATFANLGKRLAGDVAPGMELANSVGDSYIQVFINDKKLNSKNLIDKEQKDFFTKINKDYQEDYSDIEGSDAQEYTTWKEHLKVLRKLGRLTKAQYDLFYKKLSSEQNLTVEEVKMVLQPMKPVYVGNKIMEGVDRRIYIKSSSFPLLPQLTKGFEIDKLRIALTKFEDKFKDQRTVSGEEITVRASFNTANKVGGVKTSVDLFDDNGNIFDNLEINDSNSLSLSRENFRIQQDVPYKEDKDKISVGTQEQSLLFSNLLDVEGFKYEGKTLSGSELKNEYLNTYNDLFKYKYAELRKSLKLDDTIEVSQEIDYTTVENSIFEKLETAKTRREKKVLELEEVDYNRAKTINDNFDKIIEELVKNKINVFTDKRCD